MLIELFVSILIISLVSLIGIFTFGIKSKKLESGLEAMVAFAIGALLGDVFIHLLPELAETGITYLMSLCILAGMLVFFILEKIVHWHHCHHLDHGEVCEIYGYMSLYGDVLHNFIDGIILAGAFLASIPLGITAAIAIVLHEVPQEIGDFGVLLKSGFSKKKALAYNFLTALTAFLGAIIAVLANVYIEGITPLFVAFAAGSFLYIAGTDLFPELHKEHSSKSAVTQLFFIILGIVIMSLMLLIG